MIFLNDDWERWGCWHDASVYIGGREEVVKTVVAMVSTVTLVMVLDYWWLNLQSLALVAICYFGHSGISIGMVALVLARRLVMVKSVRLSWDGDGYK